MNRKGDEIAQKIRRAFDEITHEAKALATEPAAHGLSAEDAAIAERLYEHIGKARDLCADLADREEPTD